MQPNITVYLCLMHGSVREISSSVAYSIAGFPRGFPSEVSCPSSGLLMKTDELRVPKCW